MRLLFLTQVVDDEDAVLGFVPTWLRELAARVERLVVVTVRAGAMPELPSNVEVRSLGKERGVRGLPMLLAFRREMRRAVTEVRCDAVLTHMVPKYAVLARWLGVPRSVRQFLWYTHAGVNHWLLRSERIVDKIFTASEESLRIETRKRVVTRHGIDVGFLRPDPAEGFVPGRLVTVGRLTPSKDVESLLRGLAALRATGVDASLDLVGGGLVASDAGYGRAMAQLAAEIGVGDRVVFSGAIPYRHIPAVYRGAALFVSASRTGSVDKAVLEAMACGTPVLTSNESFGPLLPDRCRFPARDTGAFASRAAALLALAPEARAREGAALRAIVARDHAVGPLMDRLVAEMEEVRAPRE